MNFLTSPWPWYVAGPIIGITVPLLLLSGNKSLGISSTLRQICAACLPGNIPLFQYDWKRDSWNLFFAGGLVLGGVLGGWPQKVSISPSTVTYLSSIGISDFSGLMPAEIFNWQALGTLKGLLMMVAGGFMVGFGTRYANGCTSGHGIFGLSTLQWPSLVAIVSFFAGGIIFSWYVLPFILTL